MSEKLESKAGEKPVIVNDLFKKGRYVVLEKQDLYEHYLNLLRCCAFYHKNSQKTFTP